MLLDDDCIERCTELVAIAHTGVTSAAQRPCFFLGITQVDFCYAQALLGLQIVLFCRDTLLPQSALTLEQDASQSEALLGGSQLTTLFGQLLAGDNRQQLALLHLVTQVDRNRFDNAGHTGHDMCGTVFVETQLARQRYRRADFSRSGLA